MALGSISGSSGRALEIKSDLILKVDTGRRNLFCFSHLRWDFVYQRPQHLLSRFAKRGRGFDMQVLYYDVMAASPEEEARLGARRASLGEVLAQSDFITLHVNLTPETHHMMNRETFARMKRSAVLVNASRGPVVDPDALYDALKDGVIAAAALDVTEPEPMPGNHKLLTLPNCLVVPHIASASFATRGKMASIAAQNLFAGIRQEPLPSFVNPDAYARRVTA